MEVKILFFAFVLQYSVIEFEIRQSLSIKRTTLKVKDRRKRKKPVVRLKSSALE